MKKPTLKQLLLAKKAREVEIKEIKARLRATPASLRINELRREIYGINKQINEKL